MRKKFMLGASVLGCAGLVVAVAALAKAPAPSLFTKPIPILIPVGGNLNHVVASTWKPIPKAKKKWSLCLSFPTMKDPYWLAANYGAIMEAGRLGVKLRILDAGGYDHLAKQISDLEDCVTSGADAVLVSAISGDGVKAQVKQIRDSGKPVIETINRIASPYVTARSTIDLYRTGFATGQYLKKVVGTKSVKIVFLPGPETAGWAVRANKGFKAAIAGSPNIKVVGTRWGDTGKDVQLGLVEDVLQGNPDLDWIVGNAPAADAAVGALADAHRSDKVKIGSFYQTNLVLDQIRKSKVEYMMNDNVVWMASMAIDEAVLLLQKQLKTGTEIWPKPSLITPKNVNQPSAGFAPAGYKAKFSVG